MTLHALTEYARYRWKAKRLHGVHSPFAYDFSEKVLYQHAVNERDDRLKAYKWLRPRYFTLLAKILSYYNYTNLHCLTHDNEDEPVSCDLLLLKDDAPGDWVRLFNKYQPYLANNCAVMVSGIHKTKRHSAKWQRLYNHPKVMCSIDLYGVGLLFFRKEFKEKQHFVLKY